MDTKDRSTASHPTIVVGFGAFGLDVLRRVLLMTAARGALTYDEQRASEDPADRKLRDLSLFHVESRRGTGVLDEETGEGSFEMMNDLYRQIVTVPDSPEELGPAMREASTRLLSAAERTTRRERLRFGLDVIVIARPSYRDLAQMVELLRPVMDELSARPNLARPGQGAERVNFIQILDFDHFWGNTQAARELQRFLKGALEQWDDRRKNGKSSFRRTYLLDRHTLSGDRDADFRVDEAALFLELLLFEGRRDTDQELFQPRNDDSPPLCAFGARVFERSAGLVTRLAAARFGVAWLEHLARPDAGGPVRLAEKLTEYAPDALRDRFGGADLATLTAKRIAEVESRLAAIPPVSPDFRARVERGLKSGCDELLRAVSEHVAERAKEWSLGPMKDLRKRLLSALDDALHGPDPASISAVAEAIARLAHSMNPGMEPLPAEAPLDTDGATEELARAAADYERFAADQVRTAELPRFWMILSALLTAAVVPPLSVLIEAVPAPDAADTFLSYLWDALNFMGKPLPLAVLVLAVLLGVTLGIFQRTARLASRRALDFYVDPDRGRLADAVRRLLDKGSPLRAALERAGEARARNVELTVRAEILREVTRLHERLKDRIRELTWARSQLSELLKIHGIDPSGARPSGKGRYALGPVRSSSRLDAKIDAMIEATPLTEQRFQDAQRNVKPFEGWSGRHDASVLLFPLRLLDRLAESYKDPLEAELAARGPAREHQALAADLVDFVEAQHDFSTGFLWSDRPEEQTQLTLSRSYLPSTWEGLPGVGTALHHHALESTKAFFEGRAYLLKLTLGVDIDQLRGSS